MKLNKEHDIDVFSCLIQGVFMRPFYIIKNKYGFYSVSFVNQTTGKRTVWKSTHTADYSEAMLIASTWYMVQGWITFWTSPDCSKDFQARKQVFWYWFCKFLRNFWTPEKSEYIQNKRAHKKSIGDYHCKEMRGMVNRYWLPFFGEEFTVGELTEQSNWLLLSGLVETPRSING